MRSRKDPFNKPWVIIASVIGIIAVVIIAVAFFLGGGGSAVPSGQTPSTSGSSTPEPTIVIGVAPTALITQVPVTVPAEGVYVEVNYLGSFAGTYGVDDNLTSVRNSGDRIFAIDNITGNISATFQKEDDSSKHDLTVQIWKDGTVQKTVRNSSAYGISRVFYTL
jgi:hypothetical protein